MPLPAASCLMAASAAFRVPHPSSKQEPDGQEPDGGWRPVLFRGRQHQRDTSAPPPAAGRSRLPDGGPCSVEVVRISTPEVSSGKAIFFQQPEIPPFLTSDPTVQSSVGPTVRCYTRYVAIIQTFVITEFLEPAAPSAPAKKNVNHFPGK